VIGAQIVDRPDEKHARLERIGLTSKATCASGERCKRLTKGGIQAFDEGGVDDATALLALE